MWVKVNEYEGLYEVNGELGLIRRAGCVRPIGTITKYGYVCVHLSVNGRKIKAMAHRIIAESLIPNITGKPHINHKDGNRSNNKISNLEWVTPKENIIHSWVELGRRNSKAKYVLNTATGIYYESIKEAAVSTGYGYQSVRHKLSGRWSNNTSLIIV
jgi:hypothetical protein